MSEITLILKDLNCPNCSAKIEKGVNKLGGVEKASFNMINKEMVIISDMDEDSLIKQVKSIVKAHEPDVEVLRKSDYAAACHEHIQKQQHEHEHVHEHSHSEDNEKQLILKAVIRLLLGGVLLAAAIAGAGGKYNVLLFVGAYAVFGYDVLLRAVKNILKGQVFDENFLMSIATIGAFAIKEYPEAASVMLFYQIGEFFQDMAVDRSTRSIRKLMDLVPEYMNLIGRDGSVQRVSPKNAAVGDMIMIKNGERVPLDCLITEGKSYLDTSALTGEPAKLSVKQGDSILSGCINEGGVLYAQVEKTYENTTVKKIMDMVESAAGNKSHTESFMSAFARIYTPVVCLGAVLLAVIPALLGYSFTAWLYRALVFLVSSCPCALVVSIPLTFFSGLGSASRRGVLIKGSNHLQTLSAVNTVVFDKTGTLTQGVFKVTKVEGERTAELCAALEKYSNHPIAAAVLDYAHTDISADKVEEISGFGIKGELNGKLLLAGNAALMQKYGISCPEYDDIGTIIYAAYDNKYIGMLLVSDEIKKDSAKAVETLNNAGITTVMVTGDKKVSAERTAHLLGIKKVYSELLPQDKVTAVENLYAENKGAKIAFMGDGINDAPVLARADVGIAMGGIGSDAAIEAADVVIMDDEPSKLCSAIAISKNTMNLARQNLVFVLAVKLAVLLLAAFGYANMWLAVFADVGVALLAILNSLRKK